MLNLRIKYIWAIMNTIGLKTRKQPQYRRYVDNKESQRIWWVRNRPKEVATLLGL